MDLKVSGAFNLSIPIPSPGKVLAWDDSGDLTNVDCTKVQTLTLAPYDNLTPADGQVWFDGTNLNIRIAGETRVIQLA